MAIYAGDLWRPGLLLKSGFGSSDTLSPQLGEVATNRKYRPPTQNLEASGAGHRFSDRWSCELLGDPRNPNDMELELRVQKPSCSKAVLNLHRRLAAGPDRYDRPSLKNDTFPCCCWAAGMEGIF